MVNDAEELDFSLKSYDDWISFLFRRSLPKDSVERPFAGKRITLHPERPLVLIEYLTRLCRELPDFVTRYDWSQIDDALWDALWHAFAIVDLLWQSELPVEPRIECVRAMESVYPNVVAKIPHGVTRENIFQMWWDLVCGGYGRGKYFERERYPIGGKRVSEKALIHPNGPVLQAVFESLQNILALDDWCCKDYALHGLGHCPHPGSAAVVQGFIDRNREEIETMNPRAKKWLEECRDGTVM